MTTAQATSAVRTEAVVAQVAECVQELAGLAGNGCLVESADGRLLAHHLLGADVDPSVLSALLSGSARGLHARLTERRTTGLLPTGPVLEATLDGSRVLHLALPTGAVWLLPVRAVPLEALSEPVARLASLLNCTTTARELSCLDGGPLPADLAGCHRLWVARVLAETSSAALLGALTCGSDGLVVGTVRRGHDVYLVVGGGTRTTSRTAREVAKRRCEDAARQLGLVVTAGLSCAADAASLDVARTQADAAVSAAGPGTCLSIGQVRAQVAVRRMADQASTADLGPDPLQQLHDHDLARGSDLAESLLAWLDSLGEIARAARLLGLHPNTLRYRLKRAEEVMHVDLREDPALRAVVHLQLFDRRLART